MANKVLWAYARQKWSAADREIEFNFTFEEWVSWWETQLGPNWMQLRGRTKGKYHMARKGDVGPYSAENVIMLSCSQNSSDGAHHYGESNGAVKLTAGQVSEIRKVFVPRSPEFGARALSRKYGVAHATINSCLHRRTWATVA